MPIGTGAGTKGTQIVAATTRPPKTQLSAEEKAAHPDAAEPEPTRWQRRKRQRIRAAHADRQRRARRRSTGLHGSAAVREWAIEHWVQLQRLNGVLRRGTELETRADRKKLIIARNRELALQLGVTNAELANLTHAERAALTALKAGGYPGEAIEGALRKLGQRIVRTR